MPGWKHVWLAALSALAIGSGTALAAEADMAMYTIEIQAPDTVAYDVACTIDSGGEVSRLDLSGTGPLLRKISGSAVRCSVMQTEGDDGLALLLSSDRGNRTRSATRGIGSRINIGIR